MELDLRDSLGNPFLTLRKASTTTFRAAYDFLTSSPHLIVPQYEPVKIRIDRLPPKPFVWKLQMFQCTSLLFDDAIENGQHMIARDGMFYPRNWTFIVPNETKIDLLNHR